MLRRKLCYLSFCLVLAVPLSAQILPVGSVDGTVKDPSNAVIPSAKIVLKNVQTGVASNTTTNSSGYFFFRLVDPGVYDVSAEHSGFKRALQQVTVRVGMRTTADFTLVVGAANQSVEVVGRSPLLETSTSSISHNVSQRYVSDVPLMDRNVLMLINLTPGITNNTPTGNTNGLIDVDNTSYTSANGANNRENEFLMDGIPNNITDRVAYIPTVDDVQEFTVQTNSLDAEYGHGGGMYVNVTTKGGTNHFHGNFWEFVRNDKFNANTFFANKNGSPRPVLRFNQFGLTSGGPIIKDKLFYFFTYEGLRQRTPTTYRFTVPTLLQRQGDFSQTYDKNGNLMQIADPLTTCGTGTNPACATDPNTGNPIYTRQLFDGNVIPTDRIDPVSAAVISRYPNPTSAGDPFTGANNYFTQVPAPYDGSNYSVRIDPNFYNHHMFFRWSHDSGFPGTPTPWDIGGGVGQLQGNSRAQTSLALSDVFTVSPTMAITAQLGFTRWTQIGVHPTFDPTKLGFPSSLVSQFQQQEFPNFQVQDMYYIGASEGKWYEHTNTYSFNFGAIKSAGSHNMKWGFQGQVKQNNSEPARNPTGQYYFDRGFTQPDPFVPGTNFGNGIASFLLGYPSATSTSHADLRAATATQAPYYGWYFQDDYKVTSNLTLNLGVRYDITLGATERHNHSVLGFDPTIVSPIAADAKAAYALNPIPELPVADFNPMGGLFFAKPGNRRNAVTDYSNLAPRLGLAYRLPHNTVLRAGFGMFYSAWWQPFTQAKGYETSTDVAASLDGGLTPNNTLSNPFPNGLIQPTGSSLGAATLMGTDLSFYDYWRKNIRNYRWNFGFQHAFNKNFQVEIDYVGQRSTNLSTSTSAGDAGRAFNGAWNGTGGTFNQKYYGLQSRLSDKVPNPFFGLIPAASPLGQSTITVGQLLEPYPQFLNLSLIRETGGAPQFGYNGGTSFYNSLQVSAIHRLSHGLSLQAAYTYSKLLETLHYIEPSDPAPSEMIGQFDNPNRFSMGIVYQLPVGEGYSWRSGSRVVNKVIGGWQWSAMYIYQSGYAWPLPAASATGTSPALSNQSITHWFNGNALTPLPAFTARRNPYYWNNLRSPAINNWDMAVIKNVPVYKERVRLQIRCEMLNAFNRVWFGGLDTNPLSSTYTQLTSQANNPRYIQLGMKLIY